EMFKDCKMGSDDFDNCVKNTLNSLQKYFPTGLPQYNVGSFDPFFASEVNQKRGGPNMNYRLKLKNVYEMGWSKSHVTKFRSDPRNYMVKYSQFFPEKFLEGDYEIEGRVFDYPLNNKGRFNITLYNYTQTTTAVRRPHVRNGRESTTGPVKVKIEQDGIGDMKLHISNLLRGRSVMENILDGIINVSWRPFLPMVKPLIDDLVSTAFTDIFNKNFQNFPFEEVFPR
ncbi:hypothetical protein ANN_09910, partial [Periplaneta americana]